ncbi:MAG: family 20 glycosylhydrolase [Clostridium sp.]
MSITENGKNRVVYGIVLACIVGFIFFTITLKENKGEVSQVENTLIPKPLKFEKTNESFTVSKDTKIFINTNSNEDRNELMSIAENLVLKMKISTGYDLQVVDGQGNKNFIELELLNQEELGDEGYTLKVTDDGVKISANDAAGSFRGMQTLRQLLPPEIEKQEVIENIEWVVEGCSITDKPRYEYRGIMIDVARHFFTVDEIKRQIDLASHYKINKVHLHLSDDQGWRLEIKKWPELTNIGSKTEVGGGEGGYYTQDEFKEIVNYANERYIEIIPEFDMPGHTNSMLASYDFLNPDGKKQPLYTGMEVGFSTLMCRDEKTYELIEDVIKEVSEISPSKYFHIGGDEAHRTSKEDYNYFMSRVSKLVESYGKTPIGWDPSDRTQDTSNNFIAQLWSNNSYASGRKKGVKIIISKAEKMYLDMKYDSNTPYGLVWAGMNPIDDSYNYDPTDYTVDENIIGVEAVLWTETISNDVVMDSMIYPRLLGHSEIGWSQKDGKNFDEYKLRLKEHGERLENMGIKYYKDTKIWE